MWSKSRTISARSVMGSFRSQQIPDVRPTAAVIVQLFGFRRRRARHRLAFAFGVTGLRLQEPPSPSHGDRRRRRDLPPRHHHHAPAAAAEVDRSRVVQLDRGHGRRELHRLLVASMDSRDAQQSRVRLRSASVGCPNSTVGHTWSSSARKQRWVDRSTSTAFGLPSAKVDLDLAKF